MPFLLTKERRIRRTGEYRRVYDLGEKRVGKYLVLFRMPVEGRETGRVGITVSRKVGGACERNLVKRRIREALMQELEHSGLADDIVFVAKSRIKQADFMDVKGDIKRLLGAWQGGQVKGEQVK